MAKLSRKAVKEGLDQFPIDGIVLGAISAKESRLTPKQREFARQIALGETKAGAYRKAYKSKGKPNVQSIEGSRLASAPKVSLQIEAFKLAIEAERSRTPAHLRALVIHKLTEKALDPDCPPAQQIKALELLGKITEVAAFTERREVVQVKDSGEIRARLMDSIRAAINAEAVDVDAVQVDSLLAEISGRDDAGQDAGADLTLSADNVTDADALGGEGSVGADGATPPEGTPQNAEESHALTLHSIPDIESPDFDNESSDASSPTELKTGEIGTDDLTLSRDKV
jgi:hypothetical protein